MRPNIKVTGEVDVNKLGDYELKYSVSDAAGNATEKVRRVFGWRYGSSDHNPKR